MRSETKKKGCFFPSTHTPPVLVERTLLRHPPRTTTRVLDERHPIFRDIERGNLAAVKQRVLADAVVLEKRDSNYIKMTLLISAICDHKTAIAL